MFHDKSWKTIYFGVKRSKVKVTSHKNIAGRSLRTSRHYLHLNDLFCGRTCQNTLLCFLYDAEDSAGLLSILSDVLVYLV